MKKSLVNITNNIGLKEITLMLFLFSISVPGQAQEKPWFNSKLDLDTRISELLKEMTLEEKFYYGDRKCCNPPVGHFYIQVVERGITWCCTAYKDANGDIILDLFDLAIFQTG